MPLGSRRSIEIPGVTHGDVPIPMGCRVGALVFSSAIPGVDPTTGELPSAPSDQVLAAFANVRAFLDAADVTSADIVRLSVAIDDDARREDVNAAWVELFPDPSSRPARHTTVHSLRLGMHIQLEVVAVARTSSTTALR